MAIYQRVLDYQWTEGLTAEEQQRVLAQLDAALKQAGGMRIVMIACSAEHALSEWNSFGFEVFSDELSRAAFVAAAKALPELDRRLEHDADFAVLGLNQCLLDLG